MSSRPRSPSRPASFGRLVWIVPVCGLLALGLTWWLLLSMLQAERAQVLDSAEQRVRGLTRAFEAHTRSALRQVDQTARFVAYSYRQQAAAMDLDAILQQSGPSTPGVVGVHVADAQGRVVASTVAGPAVSLADREHFKVHVDGRFDGLFISKPVLGRLSKRWTVQMTRRIEAPDGRFLGVVIVSADPAYFTSFYNEQQFGQRGLVSVVGLDGVVRARRIGEQVWYGTPNTVAALPQALQRQAEGTLHDTSQIDGRARSLGYRLLDGFPFVVLAGLDEQEVLRAHELRRVNALGLMAMVSVVVVLLLAGLALLLARLQASHLQRAASERRLKLIADNVPALISQLDADGRYLYANRHFERLLGIEPSQLLGRPLAEARDAGYVAQVAPAMNTVLSGQEVNFESTLVLDGARRHFQQHYVPDIDEAQRVKGFYSITFDITEHTEVEQRLSAMARTDALTGLPNRLFFHERLAAAQAWQRRSGKGLALLYLDVDRFKRINDVHGHAGGDLVLKEFARRLRRCVRETDTVARLAGDEFVILLENLRDAAEAQKVARKVLAAFDPPVALGEESLSVGTSIGVVFDDAGQHSPDDLLAMADEALYRAKRMGRGRVQLWREVQEVVLA
jgi:diguanylate cyclase (GGDEF)-like protein/PAS domain S-box-containing protein